MLAPCNIGLNSHTRHSFSLWRRSTQVLVVNCHYRRDKVTATCGPTQFLLVCLLVAHAKVGCASLRPFDKQPVAVIITLRGGVISCQHRLFITNYQQRNWDCTGHEVASLALLGGVLFAAAGFIATHTSTHTLQSNFLQTLKPLLRTLPLPHFALGGVRWYWGELSCWSQRQSNSHVWSYTVSPGLPSCRSRKGRLREPKAFR